MLSDDFALLCGPPLLELYRFDNLVELLRQIRELVGHRHHEVRIFLQEMLVHLKIGRKYDHSLDLLDIFVVLKHHFDQICGVPTTGNEQQIIPGFINFQILIEAVLPLEIFYGLEAREILLLESAQVHLIFVAKNILIYPGDMVKVLDSHLRILDNTFIIFFLKVII